MAWPDDERPKEFRDQRAIIRHMKANTEGLVRFDLFPRNEFWEGPKSIEAKEGGASFAFKQGSFGIWASFPLITAEHGVFADLELKAGGEHWVVMGWNVVGKLVGSASDRGLSGSRELLGRLEQPA